MLPVNTLAELIDAIEPLDAALPVHFETPAGEIKGGYHITELKFANITSIDCGARMSAATETVIQISDGDGGNHMAVERLAAILIQSSKHIVEMSGSALKVECGLDNASLEQFVIAGVDHSDAALKISLKPARATCKPAEEWRQKILSATGLPPTSSCCAPLANPKIAASIHGAVKQVSRCC